MTAAISAIMAVKPPHPARLGISLELFSQSLEELKNRNIAYITDSNNNIQPLENIQDIDVIQKTKSIIVDNKEVPLINVIDCVGKYNE